MRTLKFKLEVITPMFIAGADQHQPEIRPPSIRGALRFWFRAMMGGVLGGDWRKVKEKEDEIFGSTDVASRIKIRKEDENLNIFDPKGKKKSLKGKEGVVYLAFLYVKWDRQQKCFIWNHSFIEPGSTFSIELVSPPSTLSILIDSFWLFLHFGGLGARTRRGFGSLSVKNLPMLSEEGVNFDIPDNPSDLCKYFKKNLNTIQQHFAKLVFHASDILNTTKKAIPGFSCFSAWKALFLTNNNWNRWENVLNDVGQFLRKFRNQSNNMRRPTPDYNNVVSYYLPQRSGNSWVINHNRIKNWDLINDAFGLPIQFRSSSRSRKVSTYNQKFDIAALLGWEVKNKEFDRRASPLIIRPLFLRQKDRFVTIFLLFKAQFLPVQAKEHLKPIGKWPPKVPKPGLKSIKPASLDVLIKFLDKAKGTFRNVGELPEMGK